MEIKKEYMKKTIDFGNGKQVSLDMGRDLQVDEQNLSKEFAEQAARYGYLAVITEMAFAKRDELEHELDQEKARAYHRLKGGDYLVLFGLKPTEDGLKHAVRIDETVVALQSAYLKARHDAGTLYAFKSAFEQRKEMLISLGADQRKEWAADKLRTQ
jgi:hypothetical protein